MSKSDWARSPNTKLTRRIPRCTANSSEAKASKRTYSKIAERRNPCRIMTDGGKNHGNTSYWGYYDFQLSQFAEYTQVAVCQLLFSVALTFTSKGTISTKDFQNAPAKQKCTKEKSLVHCIKIISLCQKNHTEGCGFSFFTA